MTWRRVGPWRSGRCAAAALLAAVATLGAGPSSASSVTEPERSPGSSPRSPGTGFAATIEAFTAVAGSATAAQLSVWRGGDPVLQLADGATRSGEPLTTGSPMVIASVSKLVTMLTVARLDQLGLLAVDEPVPWEATGLAVHPEWNAVTVRDLLAHTSGMPVARDAWLDDPGSCVDSLAGLVAVPPAPHRGEWRYSNGNYCALGAVIEGVTGRPYDRVAQWFVLGPAGARGARLTVGGPDPGDGPHARDIARFDRLGAAGQWLAGTDHVAVVLARVGGHDRGVLRWPAVFVDQYGRGHTGTVRGAVACAWVLEEGRTVVAATVAGSTPTTGGALCDRVVPAVALDVGVPDRGRPDRSPR